MDLLGDNPDSLKELVQAVLQEVLEAEMTETIGAAKGERNAERRCYRRLEVPFAYLIINAKYERVCEAGVVRPNAMLVAIGVDWDGRRQILVVELANRESRSSWKDSLLSERSQPSACVALYCARLGSPVVAQSLGSKSAFR